jgi:outer membrane protein assembly factor BamB
MGCSSTGSGARPGNPGDPKGKGASGPAVHQVLWVYKAQEHYIASTVPGPQGLYVAGLGAFNTGVFHCMATDPKAPKRVIWTKTTPFIKRPLVCAPAMADGFLVFGDGMHQTDDALLYCLKADTGRPIWQLPVPGKLIHLEGSPVIDKGRVLIGGGDAGVLCVDLTRVTLNNEEHNLATVQALIEKRWQELVAKYEDEKKKQGDLAVPPNEDALPKPAPVVHWRQGQGKWHVDAPLAVGGDFVFAASAYIDEEKIGKRCLLGLKTADGSVVWEAPLKVNPWAGPTVAGDLVLVGCSSIRFDTKKLKEAAGEVVAVGLTDGQVKWRKDVPGGILSRIFVRGDVAIFTATDGKVRAWSTANGEERWAYDAGSPLFAGPAVVGGMVYVADLKGVLHAIRAADGKKVWAFNVTADPAVQLPGMVYGTPAVLGGRIYLATCNIEGKTAGQPSAIICLSEEAIGEGEKPTAVLTVDKKKKTITIPCKIAPRQLPTLKEVYPIEVMATYPSPLGQKAHETVVTFEVKPSEVHKALEELGLKPGKPVVGDEDRPTGPEVRIFLELGASGEPPRLIPFDKTLVDRPTDKPIPPLKWYFTGSTLTKPDPDKEEKVYGADLRGTLITLFPVTDETVIQSNFTNNDGRLLKVETNKGLLPAEGAEARLIIAIPAPEPVAEESRPLPLPEPLSVSLGAVSPFAPLSLLAAAPQPWRASRLVQAPAIVSLPLADVRHTTSLLPSERQQPVRPRPIAEMPPLVSEACPSPAARPLPVGPLARAASPDPTRPPALRTDIQSGQGRPAPFTDPTEVQSRALALSGVPGAQRNPAPFLHLVIPDPFEGLGVIQLRLMPPDNDPPATVPGPPDRPVLPTRVRP